MDRWMVEALGFIGTGLIFLASALPQRRSLHILRVFGQFFWLAYGHITGTYAVIVANYIGIAIDSIMAWKYWRSTVAK